MPVSRQAGGQAGIFDRHADQTLLLVKIASLYQELKYIQIGILLEYPEISAEQGIHAHKQ